MSALVFRRHLLHRLLVATGLLTAACSQEVVVEDDAAGGNGSTNNQVQTHISCIELPACPSLDNNCVMGQAGAPPIDTCPTVAEASLYMDPSQIGCEELIAPAPASGANQCCYEAQMLPCVGRPFVVAGHAQTAHLARRCDWSDERTPANVEGLDARTRRALADAWTRDALYEHASIASFGRFALELLAVGAPAELVEAAHRAALDEVRHARACFRLASAYAGEAIGPSAMAMPEHVEVSSELASIAARAVVEGCVGETVAAAQAAEQLARATDPAVREVLAAIADEEAAHAELAWRTVAWAIRRGGERVRAAVAEALAGALREPVAGDEERGTDLALEAHGRLSSVVMARIREQTSIEVIAPCARALLTSAQPQPRAV